MEFLFLADSYGFLYISLELYHFRVLPLTSKWQHLHLCAWWLFLEQWGPLCSYMWQAWSAKELTPPQEQPSTNGSWLSGYRISQLPFLSREINLQPVFYTIPQSFPIGLIFSYLLWVNDFTVHFLLDAFPSWNHFSTLLFTVPETSQINYLHWILGGTQTKMPSKC